MGEGRLKALFKCHTGICRKMKDILFPLMGGLTALEEPVHLA